MGWFSWHSASDVTYMEILNELGKKLEAVGLDKDGLVHIEIKVRGAQEEKLTFEAKNPNELVEMIKLNSK